MGAVPFMLRSEFAHANDTKVATGMTMLERPTMKYVAAPTKCADAVPCGYIFTRRPYTRSAGLEQGSRNSQSGTWP
jgi:hypothetical protein